MFLGKGHVRRRECGREGFGLCGSQGFAVGEDRVPAHCQHRADGTGKEKIHVGGVKAYWHILVCAILSLIFTSSAPYTNIRGENKQSSLCEDG